MSSPRFAYNPSMHSVTQKLVCQVPFSIHLPTPLPITIYKHSQSKQIGWKFPILIGMFFLGVSAIKEALRDFSFFLIGNKTFMQ